MKFFAAQRLLPLLMALCLAPAATAQGYDPEDPQTGSALQLLDVPNDPIAYHDDRGRALALAKAGSWTESEPLLKSLVARYPRDPETWYWLGEAGRELGHFSEAAAAYERAADLLGWGMEISPYGYPVSVGYKAAGTYLAAGDRKRAFALLRKTIEEKHGWYRARLFDSPMFSSVRTDPEFLEIIGRLDPGGWTRNEGWSRDIDHLVEEVKLADPDYHDRPLPAEFVRRYRELKARVGRLSGEELFYGMQRMLAVLNHGHTSLWADQTARVPNRFLPVRFYAFPEGIYVIGAAPGYERLIGARVQAFGTLPADEALRRLNLAKSRDGDMEWMTSVSRLAETYYLKGMGATASVESVPLELQMPDGASTKIVIPTFEKAMAGKQDLLLPPPGIAAPLFLSRMGDGHWERLLPEHDALYVQVNRVLDEKDETLNAYGDRLWSIMTASKAKNLIIDLRHDDGGVIEWYPRLLQSFIAFSRESGHHVYVLIGRRTYSAAAALITDLARYADPVFVGEASGECCNYHAPGRGITLPYSRIAGYLATHNWQWSSPMDDRREMSPHVPIQLTAKAFFGGQDPALDAIFQLIGRGDRPASAAGRGATDDL